MKTLGPFVALVVLSIIAAGCAGQALNSSMPAAPPVNAVSVAPNVNRQPRVTLVVPLAFNGTAFSLGRVRSCANIGDAQRYTPRVTRRLTLDSNVVLRPTCVPKRLPASNLYVAGGEVGKGGDSDAAFTPIAGPVRWHDNPWSFTPSALGIRLNKGAHYVFYVAALPKDYGPSPPSPGTGNYVLLHPLSFNGTSFTVVPGPCFQGDPGDAPPYVAPTSGPLVLNGAVTVTPSCVPSPLPSFSPLPQLYIVAIPLANVSANRHRAIGTHWPLGANLPNIPVIPAVAIAGPASIPSNPWVFAPDSPGLTMQGGMSYGFFIAIALPSPPPTPSPLPSGTGNYFLLHPLSFNGTTFTVVPGSCFGFYHGNAPPYVAPTSGPLTLSGPVTVTPTCVPSPLPSALPSSAPIAQLYIVALPLPSSPGAKPLAKISASWQHGRHHGIPATAIAGPAYLASNPWTFAPDTPGLTMAGGTSYGFFIAIQAPSPPPVPRPPQPYHAVVPLNFDGTTFTVANTGDCTPVGVPTPYAPPSSGPLTLAGPVLIEPTCAPSSSSSGGPQLYIIATVAHWAGRYPSGSSPDWGGPYGNHLWGIAIAGPVSATSDPWSFAPLAPALALSQGIDYLFYVASPSGPQRWGGPTGRARPNP
jgi:hypothetical protein